MIISVAKNSLGNEAKVEKTVSFRGKIQIIGFKIIGKGFSDSVYPNISSVEEALYSKGYRIINQGNTNRGLPKASVYPCKVIT